MQRSYLGEKKDEEFTLKLMRAYINYYAGKRGLGIIGITETQWAPIFFLCKPIINKYTDVIIDQVIIPRAKIAQRKLARQKTELIETAKRGQHLINTKAGRKIVKALKLLL